MIKVSFYNQGCRLNQAETATLSHSFEMNGFLVVDFQVPADIVVVNTCTVTENGDADTRRLVNKINRINPHSKIALIGCQAQILKEKLLELPNVTWVVGNAKKMDLLSILNEAALSLAEPQVIVPKIERETFRSDETALDTRHTRANLKIQDGCDFYCSFCVIPFARGPARSREFDDILREAKALAQAGHQEVVVTGVNIGTYHHEEKTFTDVMEALVEAKTPARVRISSIEPTTIDESLVQLMAKPNSLCRYFHIPLQSGSDTILKGMSRKYTLSEYDAFIRFVKDTVPDVCIGTDVIVGFPGETDELFEETETYLRDSVIDYFHVFSYSERQFARSRKMDAKVDPAVIKARSARLRALSERKRRVFMQRFLGRTEQVLFEQKKHGYWSGLTDHFIRVRVNSDENLENRLLNVRLVKMEGQSITGVIE